MISYEYEVIFIPSISVYVHGGISEKCIIEINKIQFITRVRSPSGIFMIIQKGFESHVLLAVGVCKRLQLGGHTR